MDDTERYEEACTTLDIYSCIVRSADSGERALQPAKMLMMSIMKRLASSTNVFMTFEGELSPGFFYLRWVQSRVGENSRALYHSTTLIYKSRAPLRVETGYIYISSTSLEWDLKNGQHSNPDP